MARKQAILPLCLELVDHLVQIDVGQAVAVIGEKHLLALDVIADGPEALADIAPYAGVDQRDAPIFRQRAEEFDLLAMLRDDAIGIGLRPVVQEEVLDDVGFIAKAEHEVACPYWL